MHATRLSFRASAGLFLFLLSLNCGLFSASADSVAISEFITRGAAWRHLNNGTNPGSDWRELNFDDSGWKSGPAQLGYGDGDEATITDGADGLRPVTAYFRHTFHVDNPQSYTALLPRVLRDDGVVVYLNGVEWVRDNMPAAEITHETLAVRAVGGDEEQRFFQFARGPSGLREGENVLAVEVHQASLTSSDLSFDLELIGIIGETPNALPVVSIRAVQSQTSEPLLNALIAPGQFVISHTGSTELPLVVSLAYAGTASAGADYEELPRELLIPAGTNSASFLVLAKTDGLVEGTETVIARVLPLPPNTSPEPVPRYYDVDPERGSATVHIADADRDLRPVVSIAATVAETTEPSPEARIQPGRFLVTRTGGPLFPLRVYVAYGGTATPWADYRALEGSVVFPEGASEVELLVEPVDDERVEGDESVIADLKIDQNFLPPNYTIDPERHRAEVIIHDNGRAGASLAITSPEEGATFRQGTPIPIRAVAIDPAGYISRVEFYANGGKIGVSEIAFVVPPDPGTPIHHEFEWNEAPPGEHALTARAAGSAGEFVGSEPVGILVASGSDAPVLRITAPDPAATEFPSELDGGGLRAMDPAQFQIRREGDLSGSLLVFYSVHGTAGNGQDYDELSGTIEIPVGQDSVALDIIPLVDVLTVVEPMETVGIRLEPSPLLGPVVSYEIDPRHREAAAVIYEGRAPLEGALELAMPSNGSIFRPGEKIIAAAFHPSLPVTSVDFYAGDVKIGSSQRAGPTRTFLIEAEDFDFEGGQHRADADLMPYHGGAYENLGGAHLVDYSRPGEELAGDVYRTSESPNVPMTRSDDLDRGDWTMEVNYRLGWMAQDAWLNYTRNFPPGLYRVYAGLSYGNSEPNTMRGNLARVVAGIGTQEQTVEQVGIFSAGGSGNWSVSQRVPLTREGEPVTLELGGESTLRFTAGSGDYDYLLFERQGEAPIGPVFHSFVWTHPPAGAHTLQARATLSNGQQLVSSAIGVTVEGGVEKPVVSIYFSRETLTTLEPVPKGDYAMGQLEIGRTGPTTEPLEVHFDVGGTATPDADYFALSSHSVVIPQNQERTYVRITAKDDGIPEEDETVTLALSESSSYQIDPARRSASVTIYDGDGGGGEASIEITSPADGAVFDLGSPIQIEATAIDPRGYISRVEFFAGETLIGVSELHFFRAPDPGTPIHHSFEWTDAPAGEHVLTVRAIDSGGERIESLPVRIRVAFGSAVPILRVSATDPEATEHPPELDGGGLRAIDPAQFQIRREGDVSGPLLVFYSVHGTAENGQDYDSLPGTIEIPSGQDSVVLDVIPMADVLTVVEPMETVGVRLEPSPHPIPLGFFDGVIGHPPLPAYEIDPRHREAAVVIYEGRAPLDGALDLAMPSDGSVFRPGGTILAAAFHPSLPVMAVDFYAGERKIGSSQRARTFLIEAEDFDFEGGQHRTAADIMPYHGGAYENQGAVHQADYSRSVNEPEGNVYRKGEIPNVPMIRSDDLDRGEWSMEVNYRLGWLGQDAWFNYTRDFPPGQYRVYAGLSYGNSEPDAMRATLARVTHGAGTREQAVEQLGVFKAAGSGAWTVIHRVPLTKEGEPLTLELGGESTLRFTSESGDYDYLIFEPQDEDQAGLAFHAFRWMDPAAGPHTLTARATLANGQQLVSSPIGVTVEAEVEKPLVSIHFSPETLTTLELKPPGETGDFALGQLEIRRTGPTAEPLEVFFEVHGTATPGEDYFAISPRSVVIPPNLERTHVRITVKDDGIPEEDETVTLTLTESPNYRIDSAHRSASIPIYDGDSGHAIIEITSPHEGAVFEVGSPIQINATAIDPNGYISRVGLFVGDTRIGDSQIDFIVAPDPGTPVHHSFVWTGAPMGEHFLTARAVDSRGQVIVSGPVRVTVGTITDRVVVAIEARDPLAAEAGPAGLPDSAAFVVRRVSGRRDVQLRVGYEIGGTARNGIDYLFLRREVEIPAGELSAEIVIHPVQDQVIEGEETVILKLIEPFCIAIDPPPPECYVVGHASSARVVIVDHSDQANHSPVVRISRPEKQPDGTLRLQFSGSPGQNCVLETSSDLVNWVEVNSVYVSEGTVTFSDVPAEPQRYYRLRIQ